MDEVGSTMGPTHSAAGPGRAPQAAWRRWLVPRTTSERHAIQALVVGFLLEGLTEIYQFVSAVGSASSSPAGYYLSLATTILGFYFLWRGLHEWNRLHPRSPRRSSPRQFPWLGVGLLVGGFAATALLNLALGSVGAGDSPPVLAWAVGAVMVLAVGAFFLSLRTMISPCASPFGQWLGWTAFFWSLAVSTVAGLALGQVIVGLFIDFFTSWSELILDLAPFIFAIAPLFVTFLLLVVVYAGAYGRAGATPDALVGLPRS